MLGVRHRRGQGGREPVPQPDPPCGSSAALVIALLESLGEQRSADEIPHGDVAAAEL